MKAVAILLTLATVSAAFGEQPSTQPPPLQPAARDSYFPVPQANRSRIGLDDALRSHVKPATPQPFDNSRNQLTSGTENHSFVAPAQYNRDTHFPARGVDGLSRRGDQNSADPTAGFGDRQQRVPAEQSDKSPYSAPAMTIPKTSGPSDNRRDLGNSTNLPQGTSYGASGQSNNALRPGATNDPTFGKADTSPTLQLPKIDRRDSIYSKPDFLPADAAAGRDLAANDDAPSSSMHDAATTQHRAGETYMVPRQQEYLPVGQTPAATLPRSTTPQWPPAATGSPQPGQTQPQPGLTQNRPHVTRQISPPNLHDTTVAPQIPMAQTQTPSPFGQTNSAFPNGPTTAEKVGAAAGRALGGAVNEVSEQVGNTMDQLEPRVTSREYQTADGTRVIEHSRSYPMTLLLLFASIGLNLYLGWIAWDTYNRYQDLVADMRHTSSTTSVSRDRSERRLAESAAAY